MHSSNYIQELEAKARALEAHGLGTDLDALALGLKICDLYDMVGALARHSGVQVSKDHRGRWRVAALRKGGE